MSVILDEKINESPPDPSKGFSKIAIGCFIAMIITGVSMSSMGLPGLPLSIPGIGFLIGHLTFRMITRELDQKSKNRALIGIISLVLFVIAQIEILNFISYNAVIICVMAFLLWVVTEYIFWQVLLRNKTM